MSLGCPDDRIGIVVYNDGDVFVALPVAGLINTDVDQVIKTSGTLRLDHVQCPVDTAADRFPVDPHVLGYRAARQIDSQPSDGEVKVFRKAASRVGPRDIRNEDAVFGALNAVCAVLNLD